MVSIPTKKPSFSKGNCGRSSVEPAEGRRVFEANLDRRACHHVALLTPEALLRVGLRPSAKVLDLKGRLRCRGCGRKGRAVVSVKWRA
jgi:hypothetical protein